MMISLDNIVYILRQEADAVRQDIQARYALTDRARRYKERQVRLLENAIGSLEAYIRERERALVPVYDVPGVEPDPAPSGPAPQPTPVPEGGFL